MDGSRESGEVVAGVVLSAGGSSRMGRPKALLKVGELSLVEGHIAAMKGRCHRVIVVTGAHHDAIAPIAVTSGAEVVRNEEWATSDSIASLRVALKALGPVDALVVTPVDTHPASSSMVERLLAEGRVAVAAWREEPGHPVVLSRREIEQVLEGNLEEGLRTLTRGAALVEGDGPLLLRNLNTPEQWGGDLEALESRECIS